MELNGHGHKILLCLLSFLCFLRFLSASKPPCVYFVNCGSNTTASGKYSYQEFVGDAPSNAPFIWYETLSGNRPANAQSRWFVKDAHALGSSVSYTVVQQPKLSFILSSSSTVALRDENRSSGSLSLYNTARIFKTTSSYKFSITASGLHVVRLHFFPFISHYDNSRYDLFSSVFDVSVHGFPLLRDFRFLNNSSLPVIKEFFLPLESRRVTVSFKPSARAPSCAFINAIEVFWVPDILVSNDVRSISSTARKKSNGLLGQVLETIHRINVGGPEIFDNNTLWGTWVPDEEFLKSGSSAKQAIPRRRPTNDGSPQHAPLDVYSTARELKDGSSNSNMTWIFPVSSGYQYLVRLHFCDIVSSENDELYFNVYINGYLAWKDFDLSNLTHQALGTPYYTDFVAKSDDKGLVHLSLGPSEKSDPSKRNAILNGVGIMKMKGMMRVNQPSPWKRRVLLSVGVATGNASVFFAIVIAILLRLKQKRKSNGKDSPLTKIGRKISLAAVQLATKNFDESLLIGRGGFGNVYKGMLKEGTKVAVKRSTPGSRQGLSEFHTEIMIFSKIRHRHVVSLIGYCDEGSEMILVYEFMENGMLRNHLYGTDGLPYLSWRHRLLICIGSARGLHYLHTGPALGIIHRDIKSANILLDENYVAKVADFGISRPIDSPNQSHVTTNVKGSFGYFDPEYFRCHHLTSKSDVYAFGVVMLEVLCARPAINHSLPFEQLNLANWAMLCLKEGLLDQIIDPRIKDDASADSLQKFGETAERCLAERGADRPTMAEVLWNLEYALRLQDMATNPARPKDSIQGTFSLPIPITPILQNELNGDSILSAPVPVRPNEGSILSSSESLIPAILNTW